MNEKIQDEIKKNSSDHADFRVAILEMQKALYGDGKNGDIGMVAKVDETYAIVVGWAFVFSVIKWIGSALVTLGTIIGIVWHFLMTKAK